VIDASLQATSLVTAFNARTLSTKEVAQTFVPPSAFYRLINTDNAVLSGPRGSGKTTMLKMLQPEALETWRHTSAAEIRQRVTYTGVFIPTDRAWNAQLLPYMPQDMPPEARATVEVIADSAFAVHVLRSMVQGMIYRAYSPDSGGPQHLRVPFSSRDEEDFASNIASGASLEVGPPTLVGIANSLSLRLAYLGRLRRRVVRTRSPIDLPDWIDLDCLELASLAASLFNSAVDQPEHRWALLFDELELAPRRIVPLLLAGLRGQNPNLMFKLSFSPVHLELEELHNQPLQPAYGQDFEFIPLTYAKETEALRFSRQLLQEELARRGRSDFTPFDLLGPSMFEFEEDVNKTTNDTRKFGTPSAGRRPKWLSTSKPTSKEDEQRHGVNQRQNPYSKNSRLWKSYKGLARTDPSFASWLAARHVDLDQLAQLSADERASSLRSIRNIVVARDFFSGLAGPPHSRKTYSLYSGADAILTLTDGNPRLLTAMLRQLLPESRSSPCGRISVAEQSRVIDIAIDRFLVLVRSAEARNVDGKSVSVQAILDSIGEKLSSYAIKDEFTEDPPGTFWIDPEVPASIIESLVEAINLGALIHIPKPGSPQITPDLRNETFRVCYLLAPYYQLPLQTGRSVELSSLLPHGLLGVRPVPGGFEPESRQQGFSDSFIGQGSLESDPIGSPLAPHNRDGNAIQESP
jgi:hypothetical protein